MASPGNRRCASCIITLSFPTETDLINSVICTLFLLITALIVAVQEAFKAVEDIHNLIVLAKKPPRPSLMANYLQKFGLVLYKSDNYMFHACAWHRLFHLYREQRKSVSEHELQKYVD